MNRFLLADRKIRAGIIIDCWIFEDEKLEKERKGI